MASMARLRSWGSRPCAAATTEWRVREMRRLVDWASRKTLLKKCCGEFISEAGG